MCVQAFRQDPADRKKLFALVFKIGVTHLQTLGIMQGLFPNLIGYVTPGPASLHFIPTGLTHRGTTCGPTFVDPGTNSHKATFCRGLQRVSEEG